ncbi:Fhb1-1 [Hordeum vulgare]|nr:Fhb1-1 [Hordeum vulgare]
MPSSPRAAVMLVAGAWMWLLLLSADGALTDGGNGTVCLCTGPQCVPPCPVPGTPPTVTSPTQFPFCPQRPPAIGPFPWEQQPSSTPTPRSGFPQDAGFLAAAATARPTRTAPWLAVAAVCSAFLLLLQQ